MPITIPEGFASLLEQSKRGENPKWLVTLASIGLIDVDKSSKSNIVCTMPVTLLEYEDFKQKIEWLNPYANTDPVVRTVIDKMNINLAEWEQLNTTC